MTHTVGQRGSIITQSVDPRWPSYTGAVSGADVTISGISTIVSASFRPFHDADGDWFLDGVINATVSSATNHTIALADTTFAEYTAVEVSTTNAVAGGTNGYTQPSSGNISIGYTASRTAVQITLSGVPLDSKPTWATKVAPDVYLAGKVNVDEVGTLAFATGSQVIGDNTEGSVNFTVSPAAEDTHSGWTATDTYTVPFDGKYLITALILENANMLASGIASLEVRVNGSTDYTIDYREQQTNNTSQNIALKGAIRLSLSQDDTIELRARIDTNGTDWTPESGSYISITKSSSPQEVANAALTFSTATADRPGLVTAFWPESSTDSAVVRFDGTDGKKYQNSNVVISDSGKLTTGTDLKVTNKFNAGINAAEIGAGGTLAYTGMYMQIIGQGDVADTLAYITGGVAGDILFLRPATSGAYNITVSNVGSTSTSIKLNGGANAVLGNDNDFILLIYNGSRWCEISRSDNS